MPKTPQFAAAHNQSARVHIARDGSLDGWAIFHDNGQDGLGSSLAHLEPELILFEVNDHDKDELLHDHLPNFKQL